MKIKIWPLFTKFYVFIFWLNVHSVITGRFYVTSLILIHVLYLTKMLHKWKNCYKFHMHISGSCSLQTMQIKIQNKCLLLSTHGETSFRLFCWRKAIRSQGILLYCVCVFFNPAIFTTSSEIWRVGGDLQK